MQPKVSMIVPCYNKVKWIGEMLDSVIAQKWDNIEIILINDGSTDGTREVIALYEPRLKTRGYEVVIVDQDNQGVAAAVRNGLMRVSGEFFCQVDCDDQLDPEYVSTMAGYLCGHPEVMRVVCDAQRVRWDPSFSLLHNHKGSPESLPVSDVLNEKLLEKYLMFRVLPSACLNMARTPLLSELKIIEDFTTNPEITQEPQFFIPFSLYKIKTTYIHKPLYYYYSRENSLSSEEVSGTVDEINSFVNKLFCTSERVLQNYIADADERNRYLSIHKLALHDFLCTRISRIPRFSDLLEGFTKEFVKEINNSGLFISDIAVEQALNAGFNIVYRAVSNYLIDYSPPNRKTLDIIGKTQGSLIAYGAGVIARGILPDFKRHGIIPDVIWDIKAGKGDILCGAPIVVPDFASLSQKDTVILLLQGNCDVERRLMETDANVIYYQDVLDALASKCFPELAVK